MPNDPASPPNVDETVLQSLRAAMAKVHQGLKLDERSQHPKGHGVLQAAFHVGELPAEFQIGVFRQPGIYPAWIRFSNGAKKDDRQPDIHGMAIKLLLPQEQSGATGSVGERFQDFVLSDHPVFFAQEARHFLRFLSLKGAQESQIGAARVAGKSNPEIAALEKRQLAELLAEFPVMREFFKTVHSPLTIEYFSQVAYRFENRIVKYFARPCPRSQDLLGDALRRALSSDHRTAMFEFGIELQSDPSRMPIEDATVPWNSPDQIVLATISIPPQDFSSAERKEFGEALSFSPWHSLREHEPVGSLNIARRDVYADSFAVRHELKEKQRQEKNAPPVAKPALVHFDRTTLSRYFDSLQRGDYRGMQSCLHPQVEFHDIGFDLKGKEVGAMWHMILSKGLKVSAKQFDATGSGGAAEWECDYDFHRDDESAPRAVHNKIRSTFEFEGGLIRKQIDECDFWKWFSRALGPAAEAARWFDGFHDWLEYLLRLELPLEIEPRMRAQVKEAARRKITGFIADHPEYGSS